MILLGQITVNDIYVESHSTSLFTNRFVLSVLLDTAILLAARFSAGSQPLSKQDSEKKDIAIQPAIFPQPPGTHLWSAVLLGRHPHPRQARDPQPAVRLHASVKQASRRGAQLYLPEESTDFRQAVIG